MADIAALIGPWVAIVALCLGIFNTIAQMLGRPGRELKVQVDKLTVDTDAAIEALESAANDRFKEHDRRIQRLEDERPHMPTKEDLHELALGLSKLGTKLEGLQHTVDRMDRHLRENDR